MRDVVFTKHALMEMARRNINESNPGIVLDYDEVDNLVSLEVLDASKRVSEPTGIEFRLLNQQ